MKKLFLILFLFSSLSLVAGGGQSKFVLDKLSSPPTSDDESVDRQEEYQRRQREKADQEAHRVQVVAAGSLGAVALACAWLWLTQSIADGVK